MYKQITWHWHLLGILKYLFKHYIKRLTLGYIPVPKLL